MIDLYYWPTPNGKKVTILLEECAMPYEVKVCNIGKGDQFTDEFLDICPNNRMPAMVDHAPAQWHFPHVSPVEVRIDTISTRFRPRIQRQPHIQLDTIAWHAVL